MDKKGPIVLIDDDEDDLKLLIELFADMNLPNEIHLFKNPQSVTSFLQKPDMHPFLIISDINMPMVNGFELKDMLNNDPLIRKKNVPYLFFSTGNILKTGTGPSSQCFQGIFTKPVKKSEWRQTINSIIGYWTLSLPQDNYSM